MRATVDSVISQLASLESTVNNTVDPAKTADALNAEQNDILHQALKNSDLSSETKVTSKGNLDYSLCSRDNECYFSKCLYKN